METKSITLKLLIDTKANKVVFAESSKDFVDFLFFLLSLPIATVIKLLTCETMVGSIGNLYKSLANLDETYLQPTVQKNNLLNPSVSTAVTDIPLLITSSSTSSKKFYICGNGCRRGITDKHSTVTCPGCKNWLNQEISYIDPANSSTSAAASNNKKDSEGYVKEVVSYMISDDLSVTPMSMISSISMINQFNVGHLNMLQEKEVKIGSEEGLKLLKTSFESTTVLTDVFLGRKGKRSI